ncbi:TetR/AcrR family transcriptional regulator [Nonomuraea candida]|uniref:TetR/AcrR family transcriptional regulator n=1 Tax=Nonomuraea candida TaxID=359159 RepID=UPI0005BD57C1|nr:TetR/AcrR family transcriptional regulator [Nonomuraea candida]
MGSAEDGRAAIVRAATRLFAALGYDGSSIAQVADAAGVDQAEVTACFATKRELYIEVMRRARDSLADVISQRAEALMTAPPERRAQALHDFIDGYLDLCAARPEVPALWMHRWLSDASDIGDLEARSAQPLTAHIVDSVATLAEPAGADALHTTYTMIWCIHGFALSGVLTGGGLRCGIDDPEMVRRFRAHMHQLLSRGLRLPEPAAGAT